jgi:hypothetical protein
MHPPTTPSHTRSTHAVRDQTETQKTESKAKRAKAANLSLAFKSNARNDFRNFVTREGSNQEENSTTLTLTHTND